jgi:hypothetical protein
MNLATQLLQKVHEAKQAEDEMSVPKYDNLKTPNNHVANSSNATKERKVTGLGDRIEKKPTADIGTPHNEKGRKMSEDANPLQALGIKKDGGMLMFHHPNAPDQQYSIEYDQQSHRFLQRTLQRTNDVGEVFQLLLDYYEQGGGVDPRNQQGLNASKGSWPMESRNRIAMALNMNTRGSVLRVTSVDGTAGLRVPMSRPVAEAINNFVTSPDAQVDVKAAASRLYTMLEENVPGSKPAKPQRDRRTNSPAEAERRFRGDIGVSDDELFPGERKDAHRKYLEAQHKAADGEMSKPTIKSTAPATTAKVRGKQDDEPTNKGNPGTSKEEKGVEKRQFTIKPKDYKGGENEHKSMKKMHETKRSLEQFLGRKLNLNFPVLEGNKLTEQEGTWVTQQGSDYVAYAYLLGQQKNGGYRAVVFSSFNGSTAGKPKLASTKNWHPAPQAIDPNQIPPKIRSKIEQVARERGSL